MVHETPVQFRKKAAVWVNKKLLTFPYLTAMCDRKKDNMSVSVSDHNTNYRKSRFAGFDI